MMMMETNFHGCCPVTVRDLLAHKCVTEATMDRATALVLVALYGDYYGESVDYDEVDDRFCPEDLRTDWADYMVEDMADEYYDADVFPILATPAIRARVDWEKVSALMREIKVDEHMEVLFDDDF